MNADFSHPPSRSVDLVRVHRGDLAESVHRGTVVVLEGDRVLLALGAPDLVTYLRSTAKPLQAVVVVTSGAADRFGLEDAALAIAAGSHDGTAQQVEVVRSMLAQAGVTESDLRCGGHWSLSRSEAERQLLDRGAAKGPLPAVWSNCSGKHAGMLASARALGAPLEDYLAPEHPVQQEISRTIADFTGVDVNALHIGEDGCGAPVHGMSVQAMARAMVRFGNPDGWTCTESLASAAKRVGAAMSARPELVGGEKRFDTDLMRTASVRVLAKAGAEGVHGLAVPERNLGIVVKSDDGKDRGYRQVMIELLRRYDVLTDAEANELAERHGRTIKNFAGAMVGRLEVAI